MGGALLLAAITSECSAPVSSFVDTGEVEAGMVSRFPWNIPETLTVESGEVTVILRWRVEFTILNWVHRLCLTWTMMLLVFTFVRKHTVIWVMVTTIFSLLAGVLGGAVKVAIYLHLKSAVSTLESDVVRTGDYDLKNAFTTLRIVFCNQHCFWLRLENN